MVLKSGKGFPYTLTSVILRTSKNSGEAERQIPDNSDEYKILTIIPPCMQLKIMFLLVPIDLFFLIKLRLSMNCTLPLFVRQLRQIDYNTAFFK